MRYLVLSIIGICCLDVAFMSHMKSDSLVLSKVRTLSVDYGVNPIVQPLETALVDIDEPITAAVLNRPAAPSRYKPRFVLAIEHVRERASRRVPKLTLAAAKTPVLQQRKELSVVAAVAKAAARPVRTEYPQQKQDNRSLVAMLIKKPAGWVKSAVTRLF